LKGPVALRLCNVDVLPGRIVRLEGLLLSRFDGEVGRGISHVEPKVMLASQFEEGQKRGNDESSRLAPDEISKRHPRFPREPAKDVSLLFLNGVLHGLHLMDWFLVFLLHLKDAPQRLDQLKDRGVDLYVVAFFHPFSVVARVAPNKVLLAALPPGGQLVGGFFEADVLEEPLDELTPRVHGLSLLVVSVRQSMRALMLMRRAAM
jgi:hypothetical protein